MQPGTEPHAAPPRDLLLWAGILAGPVLWLIAQQVNYLLVYWARAGGASGWLSAVAISCALLSAGSAAGCAVQWRRARGHIGGLSPGGHWRRVAFMAALGALLSAFFAVAIVAFGLPPAFIAPDQR